MAKNNARHHGPEGAPPPPPPRKRRGFKLILLLLFIIILLLVILLLISLAGYGPGAGLFGKDNDPGSSETSQSQVIEESSGQDTLYAQIKASWTARRSPPQKPLSQLRLLAAMSWSALPTTTLLRMLLRS